MTLALLNFAHALLSASLAIATISGLLPRSFTVLIIEKDQMWQYLRLAFRGRHLQMDATARCWPVFLQQREGSHIRTSLSHGHQERGFFLVKIASRHQVAITTTPVLAIVLVSKGGHSIDLKANTLEEARAMIHKF